MGNLSNFFIILCGFLAGVYPLSYNGTSSNTHNNTFSKRSSNPPFTWLGALQTMAGRQGSVFTTKFLDFLKKSFVDGERGRVKIKICNKSPYDLVNAKWKGQHLKVEAPASRTVESQKKTVIVARYTKKLFTVTQKTLWVSYNISDTSHHICIYVKLKPGNLRNKLTLSLSFMYTVYITGTNSCDEPIKDPPDNAFVSKNDENGYKSYWPHVTAESALASNHLEHAVTVYISSFDFPPNDGVRQAWRQVPQANQNLNQVIPEQIGIQGPLVTTPKPPYNGNQLPPNNGISMIPDIENQITPSQLNNANQPTSNTVIDMTRQNPSSNQGGGNGINQHHSQLSSHLDFLNDESQRIKAISGQPMFISQSKTGKPTTDRAPLSTASRLQESSRVVPDQQIPLFRPMLSVKKNTIMSTSRSSRKLERHPNSGEGTGK